MTVLALPGAPSETASEQAVLGAVIQSARAAEEAAATLTPGQFRLPAHQIIFEAAMRLADDGEPVDPAAVLGELTRTKQAVNLRGPDNTTGGAYLHTLMARSCAVAAIGWHAQQIRKGWRRRQLGALATSLAEMAADPGFDPDEHLDYARHAVDTALTDDGETGTDLVNVADLFAPAIDRIEQGRPPGVIQPPWTDLRVLVPWLRPGQLVTIAARPSLGKSLLAQDLARHVGLHRKLPAILFTMEMDRDEVMDRLLAAESGVLLQRLIDGTLDEAEWARLAATAETFSGSRLIVDDTPKITLAHIRARLRGMARRDPATVAIIDYLQLMAPPGGENRQREISDLVSGLKAIAREFRIPMVMLCQLNRGPESRHDKRPYISDARESGAIENDSDVAILIHRPDHHEQESPRAGEADLIVDKNRNGPRGTATVGFQGHYGRFVDLAWRHDSHADDLEDR